MGQLIEWHDVSPAPRHFVDIMYMVVMDLHPFSLGPELHSIAVTALCLHLLDNALEHIPIVVIFIELVLGVLLTQMMMRSLISPGPQLYDQGWVLEENRMGSSMVCGSANGISELLGGPGSA